MNKSIKSIATLAFLLLGASSLTACSRVDAGNVGVKVYLLGGSKGVDSEVLGPGRYWIGFNENLYIFPTFSQNFIWTAGNDEGSPNDESISFQTIEGLVVNSDIGITYNIKPDKVPVVFQKYRRGVEEITDTYLRNMVRDSLVEVSSTLPIEAVYGKGKSDLMDAVEKSVRAQVSEFGIEVEKIYWINELRLPENVITSINTKIQATQLAQQRENEVQTAKAEAQKEIEKARGDAEARILNARAEAESIRIKGDALEKNPVLVSLTLAEKWNGILPTTMVPGSTVPFINVNPPK